MIEKLNISLKDTLAITNLKYKINEIIDYLPQKKDDFQKWIDNCPDKVPTIEEIRKITKKIPSIMEHKQPTKEVSDIRKVLEKLFFEGYHYPKERIIPPTNFKSIIDSVIQEISALYRKEKI